MTYKVVPGMDALQVDGAGNVLFTVPHGTFYSNTTQAIADVGVVQVVALELDADVHGLTHSLVTNNSRIYVQSSGSYEIMFSGICDIASGAVNKHIEVWLAIDGAAVTDSNTRVHIATLQTEMTVAVAYITDLNAGQYFELMTWGDATTVEWLATAVGASPDRPATPSVIVTAKKVSSYV